MEISFGSEIIQSYKRLSYTPWYALAEFVDNSTDAYRQNENVLKPILEKEGQNLCVRIDYDDQEGILTISDNSTGMSEDELRDALTVGKTTKHRGRSRYGLGMKTAACWLGNFWTIRTTKNGMSQEHHVTIDVEQISQHNTDVNYKTNEVEESSHYTIIKIFHLNRSLAYRTKGKIRDYLRSMYRKDFEKYDLEIYWQGDLLEWDQEEMIYSKLYRNKANELKKKEFEFAIGEGKDRKNVSGWVGVFEKGSRRDAGFSIIQYDRVIKGWPNSYRPEPLFGEGRNDLVNQRLVGELFLDDFEVSHTKDEIIFINNEQDELEAGLYNKCADYQKFALDYRKYSDDERIIEEADSSRALNEFEEEITSKEFKNKLNEIIPPKKTISETKLNVIRAVEQKREASLKAFIGDLEVRIYLDPTLSPYDPYVLIESTQNKNRVIIIVNVAHPHWLYLKSSDSILNFIRHSTYDGISEWKTYFRYGQIDPDTVKHIKDSLLRVPLEIEKHNL